MRHRHGSPKRHRGTPWRRALALPVVSGLAVIAAGSVAFAVTTGDPVEPAAMDVSGTVVDPEAARVLVTADAPSVKPTRAPSAGLAVGVTRRQAEPAVRYLVQAGTLIEKLPPPPEPEPEPELAVPGDGAGDLASAAEDAAAGDTPVAPPASTGSIPSFVVSSFNVLGSNHRGGDWEARQDRGISLIQSRGASIVGFQELQPNQFRRWRGRMPGWGFYPGESQGFKGTPTNLVWNSGVWSFVEGYTFGIPRPDGTRPQPAVKLRNNATGQQIWVVNVHNAPTSYEGMRDQAQAIEVGQIRRLVASGLPVVMTGDFNEKEEAICTFTSQTVLVSAVGGSGCSHPSPRVDWIFATPNLTQEGFYNAPGSSGGTDHRTVWFSRMRMG